MRKAALLLGVLVVGCGGSGGSGAGTATLPASLSRMQANWTGTANQLVSHTTGPETVVQLGQASINISASGAIAAANGAAFSLSVQQGQFNRPSSEEYGGVILNGTAVVNGKTVPAGGTAVFTNAAQTTARVVLWEGTTSNGIFFDAVHP